MAIASMRTWGTLAAVLTCLAVGSCASQPASKNPSKDSGSSAPLFTAGRQVRIDLGPDVGPAAIDRGDLIFPAGDSRGDAWGSVMSVPLSGGGPHRIVRSEFPDGFINWVAALGDGWILYVDQSAEQGDLEPNVLWRVVAFDRSTGEKRTLDTNAQRPDPYVPHVGARGGVAYWSSAEDDRTAREQIWKPEWSQPKDLLRHTELTPGTETLTKRGLVYLGKPAKQDAGRRVGGDCWLKPLDSSPPRLLTTSSLAMSCFATEKWVMWWQHLDPEGVENPDTIPNDPASLWVSPMSRFKPEIVEDGPGQMTYPIVVGDTAVWADERGRLAVKEIGQRAPTRSGGDLPDNVMQIISGDNAVVVTHWKRGGRVAQVWSID